MTATDLELLRQFTRDRSQDAFTELVRRHLDLVHAAALRQVRAPELAQDVAQSVFTDLARNAARLTQTGGEKLVLTAWLYAVTRRTAIDVVRKESRRQAREQIAVQMNELTATPDVDWAHLEPVLDAAMAELDEADRTAVLLRYFQNQSLREVGAALGLGEDAAQKRVSRAVDQLRAGLAKHGLAAGAGGLCLVISANAVQAAPVGLVVKIATAAGLTSAVSISTVITTTKTIVMTTIQKTLVTITIAAAVGAGIYEAHQATALRHQLETLQDKMAEASLGDLENARGVAMDDGTILNFTNGVAIVPGADYPKSATDMQEYRIVRLLWSVENHDYCEMSLNSGGSGQYASVGIFTKAAGHAVKSLQQLSVGDRVQIYNLDQGEDGNYNVYFLDHAADAGMASTPTVPKKMVFQLDPATGKYVESGTYVLATNQPWIKQAPAAK